MIHTNLLTENNALLLIIDVQERFREHICGFAPMVRNIGILAEGCRLMGLPIIVTEQYTKGLGPTVAELAEPLKDSVRFEKECFSVCGAAGFSEHLAKLGRKQVLVCGIETHVCVNQSVHELLAEGYQVHLIEDALASRFEHNKGIGLAKMYRSGALPSSVETALLEMLVRSGGDKFKAVQKLVK